MPMTVSKAIELLNERLTQGIAVQGDDFQDAICLGIAALSRYKLSRTIYGSLFQQLLPGETVDEERRPAGFHVPG